MREGFHFRRWLFYLALALPVILLPQRGPFGPHSSHFSLGWPLYDMALRIGGGPDWPKMYFEPGPILLLNIVLWSFIASFAWKARRWTQTRPDWLGAVVQAALTSLYCTLVFCFLDGMIRVIWEWQMDQLQWLGLERAETFGRRWLPYLYALGATAIFVTLFLDARRRFGLQRLAHVAFALCFAIGFYGSLPYLSWQLKQFDWLIESARRRQIPVEVSQNVAAPHRNATLHITLRHAGQSHEFLSSYRSLDHPVGYSSGFDGHSHFQEERLAAIREDGFEVLLTRGQDQTVEKAEVFFRFGEITKATVLGWEVAGEFK